MNEIQLKNSELTMSSREIAEMTGKEHKNVLSDIRAMLPQIGKATADFSATAQIDGPNGSKREVEVYLLPKREVLILVSGYSAGLRARIVDRWQELEAAANPFRERLPSNYADALRQLATSVEENQQLNIANEALNANLQVAQPKAEAFARISEAAGEVNLTNAAKTLQVQPHKLIAWLSQNEWIYKRANARSWTAYQLKIQKGLLVHRTFVSRLEDGTEKVRDQVLVTGKGLAELATALNASGQNGCATT